jgi:hypothetical protein
MVLDFTVYWRNFKTSTDINQHNSDWGYLFPVIVAIKIVIAKFSLPILPLSIHRQDYYALPSKT